MLDFLIFVGCVAGIFVGCFVIYCVVSGFQEAMMEHNVKKELYKNAKKSLKELTKLNKLVEELNKLEEPIIDYNNDIDDKTDEQLIEDWNNLWNGNPPCELDIKVLRKSEKEERSE